MIRWMRKTSIGKDMRGCWVQTSSNHSIWLEFGGDLEEKGMKIKDETNHEGLVGPVRKFRLPPIGCAWT